MAERLLGIASVAERYDNCSTSTIRRMVKKRDPRLPPPCRLRPLQWRESDLDRHLRGLSITNQLQQEARTV